MAIVGLCQREQLADPGQHPIRGVIASDRPSACCRIDPEQTTSVVKSLSVRPGVAPEAFIDVLVRHFVLQRRHDIAPAVLPDVLSGDRDGARRAVPTSEPPVDRFDAKRGRAQAAFEAVFIRLAPLTGETSQPRALEFRGDIGLSVTHAATVYTPNGLRDTVAVATLRAPGPPAENTPQPFGINATWNSDLGATMTDVHVVPAQSDATISAWSFEHLQRVVAIDSASDERSASIPSTPGQGVLADDLAAFFGELGATVERDEFANVIATFAGRRGGQRQAPIAMMVHLDTARGSLAVPSLNLTRKWAGDRVPYPENAKLCVDVETYPAVAPFVGHDIVFGTGTAPFGLDDKLGLTHLMTLARLLAANPTAAHPPLLLIGRPDEEVGRMQAVEGLAKTLSARHVDFGYTIDGILPFEINLENFNASHARVVFEAPATGGLDWPTDESHQVVVSLGGVNTHGCTAKAEGYRAATRFAAEILEVLAGTGLAPTAVVPVRFESDTLRDCDAQLQLAIRSVGETDEQQALAAVREAVAAIVEPHVRRGASWEVADADNPVNGSAAASIWATLDYVNALLDDDVNFPVAAEASEGHEGYTNPYRAASNGGQCVLDIRIRDFLLEGRESRESHVESLLPDTASIVVTQQYANMAPRLVHRPELVSLPRKAAEAVDVDGPIMPIRGGTGVDPFLDAGVPIANLGTGYFAPESEKELTSLQMMNGHARWLFALVQVIAAERADSLD